MVRCSICGEKKSKDEMVGEICQDCAASIVEEQDLDVGMDDFS
jgi:hypothetical protein